HIDSEHAFLHGPATFIYPTSHRSSPVEVELAFPEGWTLTTAAEPVGESSSSALGTGSRVRAASIGGLFGHTIRLGATRAYELASSVPARLVIWGERAPGGMFDEQRLATDLAAIVDDHVARFGEAPFREYTFILMLAHDAYGGLE